MRTKQLLTLASLALLLLAAATGCADHDNDPATTAANGLPVDFSSIRIAASANGTGGSTSNVPTTGEGGFGYFNVIHARLTHDGNTQDAWLTFDTAPDGTAFWKASKHIYWQSTAPNTGQTLTLSRGEEGDFTLPDDMNEMTMITKPDGLGNAIVWNYALHDRLFHSYRGPMPAAPITWELQHCMAQIVVTLTRADGSTLPNDGDLRNARVSMTLPAEGHFDGVNGNVSRRNTGAGGGAAGTKPVKFLYGYAQSGVHSHFAVALPGSTDTRIITITIPADKSSNGAEQTYQYTAPANITLEAGRSHVFRLSLGNRVSALSITTTEWQTAEQGTGLTEGLGIKGVTPGSLAGLLPKTVIDYGHISVSGELNDNDYGALNAFLNSLTSPVSLEIDITGGSGIIPRYVFGSCNKLGAVELKGITQIYDGAFANSSLTSITLPEGLTRIYQSAFGGCQGLKSISLPSSVTYLDSQAFINCTNLASVSLPEGLQEIEHNAFSGCTSLKSITLPSTITVVGESAFYLSGLTSIILPEGVKTIGEEAFKNCTKLLKVAVANTKDISVGTDAFAGTPGEKELFVYVEANSATFLPGTKWKGGHINYKGSGDLMEPDSYNTYYNY